MVISRQLDSIWVEAAAGRGHQHRPSHDTPHSVYHADRAAREYGESLGIKHHHESKHADQPRDSLGRFAPMPHHEKERKDAGDAIRRRGGEDLERHFHEGYRRGYEEPERTRDRQERREKKKDDDSYTHHHSSRTAAPKKTVTPKVDEDADDDLGEESGGVVAPWELIHEIDPEEEEAWSRNPGRVPKPPRITEKILDQDPYILERHEIANARGLRPKGLHLFQSKNTPGQLISEPQHYYNDDGSHNFSVVHQVVDPAHSKSGMWEVNRWKYGPEGGTVEATQHLPGSRAVSDVAGQLESNYDWDKHEGAGGRRINKDIEERYVHDHPLNGQMLDPMQYEIKFINSYKKNRNGVPTYSYDPDSDNNRWMPHPNEPDNPRKQFRGPHWMVTTKMWQRQYPNDPRSEGRYVPVDYRLFHPDDAHGALRYVYADQHGGSLAPYEGKAIAPWKPENNIHRSAERLPIW